MGLTALDDDTAPTGNTTVQEYAIQQYSAAVAAPIVQEEVIEACNCRKSRCLKLYCQCFASNNVCGTNCHCVSCCNSNAHADIRSNAIRLILERNPHAFDSKFKLVRLPFLLTTPPPPVVASAFWYFIYCSFS